VVQQQKIGRTAIAGLVGPTGSPRECPPPSYRELAISYAFRTFLQDDVEKNKELFSAWARSTRRSQRGEMEA